MTQFTTPKPAAQPSGGGKLIIIAFVLALIVALLNVGYLQMIKRQNRAETFHVYRLKADKSRGDRLKANDVEKIEIPNYLRDSFDGALVGSAALENRIEKKMPLTYSLSERAILRAIHFEEPEDVAQGLEEGERRVQLPVDSRQTPAGIRPGVKVDLFAKFVVNGRVQTMPVMQNVEITGVGSQAIEEAVDGEGQRRPRSFKTVSVDVMPEVAEDLVGVQQIILGEFIVLLRNPGDTEEAFRFDGIVNRDVVRLLNRSIIRPDE